MDMMVRMPLQLTAAGLEWMTSGIQRFGSGGSGASATTGGLSGSATTQTTNRGTDRGSWRSWANPSSWGITSDQDLSTNDLKYVSWMVIFTKPGHEAVLQPMQNELVPYSTDGASFCALKIAKCLEHGRHGHLPKPSGWVEHEYPGESKVESSRRTEGSRHDAGEKGWRIPSDDHKYVQCLYRVEWRLPKPELDVTRLERVTIERAEA